MTGVVVVVDLGYENCGQIKTDVESFGVPAVICNHDAEQEELNSIAEQFGEIKGFIHCGGACKNVRGFRPEASQAIYENKIPTYSVDHAGPKGVDLYSWPSDDAERREKIQTFLTKGCKLLPSEE